MGGIHDEHVEWAVVGRLKAMLDEPPKTKFNVTQSFALFSTVLLWTKNRAWVGGDQADRPQWFNEADHAARDAREALKGSLICNEPWLLSRVRPQITAVSGASDRPFDVEGINSDFADVTAEMFFKWLRDALAHGDGRSIRPLHRPSAHKRQTLLAGFEIVFPQSRGSKRILRLALYHADMKRLGAVLADQFCRSLSGGDRYFEEEAGTARIDEVAVRG